MIDSTRAGGTFELPVYQDKDLVLSVSPTIDPAAIRLLSQTVYGTRGVRYQHTNQAAKINDLAKPLFFYLRRGKELLGVYCLDERLLDEDSRPVKGFYGRYLAVNETVSGNGYGRLLKQQAVAYVEQHTSSPFLFYSYIETQNLRSLAISQTQGFRSIATLRTYFFRRYAPRIDSRFSLTDATETGQIKALLSQTYQTYRFKTFAHIGYQQHYFVLKEDGQVVAGVQANPVCWRFFDLPGAKGWVFMNLVPRLPATRRLFNPAQNAFVVLEGVYLLPGRTDLLPTLLESLLAHLGLHSAMCEIDERDPLVAALNQPAMGWLSGFEKDVKTQVMVKADGLPDSALLTNDPLYVSCFDYS